MSLVLRPYQVPTDDVGMAALSAACHTDPWTVADMEDWRRTFPTDGVEMDIVATENGQIVGHAHAYRYPWSPIGQFTINVLVHPRMRGQGLGKSLYAKAHSFAIEHGARLLKGVVHVDDEPAVKFATHLGFDIERHEFESRLDLTKWQESALGDVVAKVEAGGIRFVSYADEPREYDLYQLVRENAKDLPGYDPGAGYLPIEEWRKRWLEDPDSPLSGIFLAVAGEQLVGVTRIGKYNESGDMKTWHTSVLQEFRGRGIALALKILSIRAARNSGASTLLTDNDSRNMAILRVNTKLGFEPLPGIYHVKRHV